MIVDRLPVDTGPAGWNEILPAAPPSNQLAGDETADWLVIGAGFAGLAAARRLAQNNPGDRVVVLDAVRIGEGPVGRNSGFMIDLPHVLTSGDYIGGEDDEAREIWANREAIRFAMEAAADYGMPPEALTLSGKINGAATQKGLTHNEGYAEHLSRMDEPFQLLSAEEMRQITGSDYYLGGLQTPGTAMLQPAQYARGMAAGLTSNRVRIYDQSPVTGLARKGRLWSALTPKGSVTAPRVILAVNGHVESFGGFKGRLMHVMLYASMTRALTATEVAELGGEPTWGITPSDPMGTTVRRISGDGGDRIIVRNRCTYAPSMKLGRSDIGGVAADHDKSFERRFPQLSHVEMEHRWAGRLCLSLNDAPAFGEIEDGLFSACCQNGLGSSKGTFNGIAVADLASGRDTEVVRFQLSKPQPKRTPPGFLMRIGAPATIKWREHSAGREL
ncbi:MAG: FAD-binding oxidoreductase [Pseudomonadota bacterium]